MNTAEAAITVGGSVGECGRLTLSPPILLRLYTLPYWSSPAFKIFDIRPLWRSGLSARAPECQKFKMLRQTSMALNPSNSSNLKQVVLNGLSQPLQLGFGRTGLVILT